MTLLIEICLIFLLISTPLMLGTVQPWSIFIMRITVVVALLTWLIKILFQPGTRNQEPGTKNRPRTKNQEPGTNLERRTSNVELKTLDLTILVFLGVAAFSTFVVSPYKHQSLSWFTNLATYTAVYFIFVNNIKSESQIKRLIGAMLTAGTIAGVYGIFQYFDVFLSFLPHNPGDQRVMSTYYTANHYAGFLVMVTPLAISFFLFSRSWWKILIFGLLSALLVANLALSFSLGNFAFGTSMIFLILVIIWLKEWKILTRRILPAVAGFLILAFFVMLITSPLVSRYPVTERYYEMLNLVKQDLTHGRFLIWGSGLKILSDHLFLGVGLGLFNMVFSKYRPINFSRFVNYAHSDYIQISSDMGIIGLGTYLIMIITIFLKGLKTLKLTKQYNQAIVIGVITALFGAIILWCNNT